MSTAAAHIEEDHGHHHKETFVTKYVFSQDHKMISKQYLITGLFMGIIGIAMSLLFRLQLVLLNHLCEGLLLCHPFGIFFGCFYYYFHLHVVVRSTTNFITK